MHQQPRNNPRAAVLGKALNTALEQAADGVDLAPVIRAAAAIKAADLYIGTRGELIAMVLFRMLLAAAESAASSRYYDLSVRLVAYGACTRADMKAAVMGILLLVGQRHGWLEPAAYDLLTDGANGATDWQQTMSTIHRGSQQH